MEVPGLIVAVGSEGHCMDAEILEQRVLAVLFRGNHAVGIHHSLVIVLVGIVVALPGISHTTGIGKHDVAALAARSIVVIPQFGISWRLVICEDSVTNPLPVPLSTGYI